MAKHIFLLCNAHLDPVWQWEWEEGAAEALSTFRAYEIKTIRVADGVFTETDLTEQAL